jgi:putative nucleotidyltransferase with HDIG domain
MSADAVQPMTLQPPVLERLAALIREDKLDLPMLPEVAGQVVRLTNDDTVDARKLAELVTRDQSLAGNLLRLVNSPLYAPSSPIVSLQQAVARLGLKKIREIALIISCESKVFTVPGHEPWVRQQFRHALAAGAFAQEIARSRRWNVEEGFLCGLLHDVGRPVLLQVLVDLHKTCGFRFQAAAADAAIAKLHTGIGSQLVKQWALPARLSETIQYHHDPLAAPSAAQTAIMTNLADDLSHYAFGSALPGSREVDEAALRVHPMLAHLNLYPEELEALLAKRDAVLAMVRAVVP